ncbi:hypothetical protein MZE46_028890 [Pseudomonas sp. A4]|nr:hypothetical protein [Pseudomonas sp. S11A4]
MDALDTGRNQILLSASKNQPTCSGATFRRSAARLSASS